MNSYKSHSPDEGKISKTISKLQGLELKLLEKITKKFFVKVTKKLMIALRDELGVTRTSKLINECDERGLNLIHYSLALNHHEVIGVAKRCGADLAMPTAISGLSPTAICTMLDHRKSLQ